MRNIWTKFQQNRTKNEDVRIFLLVLEEGQEIYKRSSHIEYPLSDKQLA